MHRTGKHAVPLRHGGTVAEKPRILVLEGPSQTAGDLLQDCRVDGHLVRVEDPARGLNLLLREHFDAVVADLRDPALGARLGSLLQAEHLLEALTDGVAVVGTDLRVNWA